MNTATAYPRATARHTRAARRTSAWLLTVTAGIAATLGTAGCGPVGVPNHEGPGHRSQALGLTPDQESSLGEKAYEEVLSKNPVSRDTAAVERVRRVGRKIAEAAAIEPFQREINLRLSGYHFDWAFNVLESKQVNAFCLPGGKVAVYSGLLPMAKDDAQLATVMAHEIAHALAHHASERIARHQFYDHALTVVNGSMAALAPETRKRLIGLLAAGAEVNALSYDRQQESEADHIGMFLMTFAGYDPDEAIGFWENMTHRANAGHIPEILSDHPSDARRIEQIKQWAPLAKGALKAYRAGRVAPAAPAP